MWSTKTMRTSLAEMTATACHGGARSNLHLNEPVRSLGRAIVWMSIFLSFVPYALTPVFLTLALIPAFEYICGNLAGVMPLFGSLALTISGVAAVISVFWWNPVKVPPPDFPKVEIK